MQINEIFSSIDGEGIRTGYLVTFIRSYACNLRCRYCDTLYAVDPQTEEDKKSAFKIMTVDEIITKCDELKNKRITFTGGEPLIQKDALELISKLTLAGYEVNIETNGAVKIDDVRKFNQDMPIKQDKVIVTMDWKSPSSGMRDKMIEKNLDVLTSRDVLKFVAGSKEDLDDMKSLLESHPNIKAEIFLSPIFEDIKPSELVDYIKENNMQNVRVQLQLHKFIWPVSMRGV